MSYQQLDKEFPTYKELFEIPTHKSLGVSEAKDDSIYFCGNSLGLMPKKTRESINNELDAWSARAVESHFNHPNATPWMDIDLPLVSLLAPIVGAKETEVAIMGSLTSNLNALLISMYKPKGRKTKILFEKQAFPSDYYAFLNLVKLFGYDESHLIQLSPKDGETYLNTKDILKVIDESHQDLALVVFPGIQYYTGQFFEIGKITNHAKKYDLIVGWDLAHAVGNVELSLHDWNVDFAAWCSYKYLNSGPGAIAGIFVNERYTKENSKQNFPARLAGWWGNNSQERFKMVEEFDPIQSALSYRQSNPSVIDVVSLKTSLEIFDQIGIKNLRKKSLKLTKFLEDRLINSPFYQTNESNGFGFKILTPLNQEERGCQLSLLFQPHDDIKEHNVMERVNEYLHEQGIICDERRPDVIRIAPVPLYNTFEEVHIVTEQIFEILNRIKKDYI